MTIYVDGLLFLNFFFDFLLLLSVSVILKRNVSIFRIIIGAFIGSLTILILFFKITSFELFLIKVYLSIIMCLVSFGYKDLKYTLKNILFLYLVSIILGGFLYMINIEIEYKQEGLIFINKGISLNIIFLIIFSPIILYIYVKEMKSYKAKIGNYYKVNIYIGKKVLNLNGYLDTGNNLKFKGRLVILTSIKNNFQNKIYMVPYMGASGCGILECIKVRQVEVAGLGVFKDVYLGFSNTLKLNEAEVLLNGLMREE